MKSIKVTKMKHSAGECILYLDYDKEYKEYSICAVDYNLRQQNVQQVDLGSYNKKKFKKLLKKMLRFIEEIK